MPFWVGWGRQAKGSLYFSQDAMSQNYSPGLTSSPRVWGSGSGSKE